MKKLIFCALAVVACDGDAGPVGPGSEQTGTLTVDASDDWAYVAFEDGEAVEVTPADAATSAEWDMAFRVTSVMLNGGAAGAGSVTGHCICQNAAATNAALIAMTSESELADFDVVGSADIPADDEAWQTEALLPSIDEWYSYDPISHVVSAAAGNVYAVRTASGTAFAKLHVIDLEGATQAHAGTVTFAYALQDAAGVAFGAVDTVSVDVSGGAVVFDLETGTAGAGAGDDWDLRFDGWTIRVNGGVSGSGSAGAYLTEEAFEALDDASAAPARAYAADRFAGVFGAYPWYRYNLQGNHQVYPTYDVYLIATDDGVYKVQLTGYYGPTGDARQISFRYAGLD